MDLCVVCPSCPACYSNNKQYPLLAALVISPFISKSHWWMCSEVVACVFDGYLQVWRRQFSSVGIPLNNMKCPVSPRVSSLCLSWQPTSPELSEVALHLFTGSFLLLFCPLMDSICFGLSGDNNSFFMGHLSPSHGLCPLTVCTWHLPSFQS